MSTRPALARDATAARELAAALTEAASEMSNAAEPNQATDAVMLPTDRARPPTSQHQSQQAIIS
jgi:hypothetical protein